MGEDVPGSPPGNFSPLLAPSEGFGLLVPGTTGAEAQLG